MLETGELVDVPKNVGKTGDPGNSTGVSMVLSSCLISELTNSLAPLTIEQKRRISIMSKAKTKGEEERIREPLYNSVLGRNDPDS